VKLKMADNSLFAILLRSPWWASFLLAGAITAATAALAPDGFKAMGAVAALPLFGVGAVAAWRQWKAPSAARMAQQAAALRAMNWREFSAALEQHWRDQGARVQAVTGLEADFCVEHQGQAVLVSARRWKAGSHGAEPVAQLAAAMRKRGLSAAQYLVAQGTVSDSARALARSEGVALIEGDALVRMLLQRPR
jgi:restriction system protein